jgi:hypothetical protein
LVDRFDRLERWVVYPGEEALDRREQPRSTGQRKWLDPPGENGERHLVFVAEGGTEPERRRLQRRHIAATDGHRLPHRGAARVERGERPAASPAVGQELHAEAGDGRREALCRTDDELVCRCGKAAGHASQQRLASTVEERLVLAHPAAAPAREDDAANR